MITKAQAGALATQWRQAALATLPAKLEAAIVNATTTNQASVSFAYAPATAAQVDAFIASTMTPAGWTCNNDAVNLILTVS